jgi:hypothetical protein
MTTTATQEPTAEALPITLILREAYIALQPGERYAGTLLTPEGLISHHLILLPGETTNTNWADACTWATKAGGELPTRREQALLFANLKAEFQPRWYWSSETYEDEDDGSSAWYQYFGLGTQNNTRKSYEGRARAVRRVTA